MPCRRPDEIAERATVDLRHYFTTLLSSLARNRCPACREIRVQLRVKSLSSLPRNPCPACREILVQLGVKYAIWVQTVTGTSVHNPTLA